MEKLLNRAKRLCGILNDRARAIARDKALISRIGGYVALAALLTILGVASSAWRERRQAPLEPEPLPISAMAPRDGIQTPAPTVEPMRWLWPLKGEITGEFSPDAPVWSATLEQWQTHPAVDIAGTPGEAVYACGDGVVTETWRDRLWGNVIVIDHGDGIKSTCAGVNTLNLVAEGDSVSAGEIISAVGPSIPCEAEQSAHIHFALTRDGEPVDPRDLIK